jgi:hypothetical protein
MKALFAFALLGLGFMGCGDGTNNNQYGYNNGWYNGQYGAYCGQNPGAAGCGQSPYYYGSYGWQGPYSYQSWNYYPSYWGAPQTWTGWGYYGNTGNFYGYNNAWVYGWYWL